eukprot:778013-Pleurochrysis_carterae.AAC.2
MSLPRLEALAAKMPKLMRLRSLCKLEGQQPGQFIFVKRGEGFEAVVGRRATVHLHSQKLSSVRLKVDAHSAQGAQQRESGGARRRRRRVRERSCGD